jgi:formiminotetrahydrofolate cyclodeaminase
MAKSDNLILKDSSGSLGKMVTITKKKSGTIQLGKHRGESTTKPTEKQLEIQSRFKNAIIYGKAVMNNPELKAQYEAAAKKDQSAYNVAVRDAFKAPKIQSINTALYTGEIGSKITIRAIDDFKVASVRVKITNGAGVVIEQGEAVLQANGLDWVYAVSVENNEVQESRIEVKAADLPANETVMEVRIS